ncbi:MAG: hypothetical protein WBL80_08580 [Erysipelotrichaceae bacterium]
MKQSVICTGPYGVGKSEFAIQYALTQAPCFLADLDVLNPYFRPREIHGFLKEHGVIVIGNNTNNSTNLDLPGLSGDVGVYIQRGERVIVDLAGSIAGTHPLTLFKDMLDRCEVWLVINLMREESHLDQLEQFIADLKAQDLVVTGLVHNTHLLDETDLSLIRSSNSQIEKFAQKVKIPIIWTMIDRRFMVDLKHEINSPILPVEHWALRAEWMKGDSF